MADSRCILVPNTVFRYPKLERPPSLYASVRLARFVCRVKERLRCLTQRRNPWKNGIDIVQKSFNAQALQDLDRTVCNGAIHQEQTCSRDPPAKRFRLRVEIPLLLERLNRQSSGAEPPASAIALDDYRFLAYDAGIVIQSRGIVELRHIYDLTTFFLVRLSSISSHELSRSWVCKSFVSFAPSLFWVKWLANLDHILRSLKQAALEALVYHELELLAQHVQRWHQHWLHERRLDYGWFSEWPNGRRPLSTTWPWNIRPSLVVLWGVCWMFYDNNARSALNFRQQSEEEGITASFWPRQTPHTATASQQNITTWITDTNEAPFQSPAWLQAEGNAGPITQPSPQTQFQRLPVDGLSIKAAIPSLCLLESQAFLRQQPFLPLTDIPLRPQLSQQQPHRLVPTTQGIPSRDRLLSYALPPQDPPPQGELRATPTFSPSLRPPMGQMQNYPSPHSDVSKDETRSSNFSMLPSSNVSPSMMFALSPSAETSHSRPSAGRSMEDPPRNTAGQITCVHPKCARDQLVFARKCEWTKHMDKHTRPYVCNLPGCEKVRGFTYSGGLSRHQREVHRQHGGPKASYMCPHKDCKRSTGSGFSRKENLQEHVRRVHRQIEDVEVEKRTIDEATTQATTQPRRRRRRIQDDDEEDDEAESVRPEPRKRRRKVETESDDYPSEDPSQKENLAAQVKRLRKELQEKDDRLRRLEQTVELLTKRAIAS
ncbi:MAG: hypothetical protein Q9222_003202 [Ikaeria aurantiellina]